MPDRYPHRRVRLVFALLAAALLALAPTAGAASTPGLTGWLSDAPTFPDRAMALFAPAGTQLNGLGAHVTENGRPVQGLTTSLASQANPGDFGVIIAVPDTRLPHATAAAMTRAIGAIARSRQAGQEIGVVGFNSTASVLAPLAVDTGRPVGMPNPAGSAAGVENPGAAITAGVRELQRAHVALGGIILLSDGAGVTGDGAAARAAAVAANIPVLTVGIADANSTPAGLSAIDGLGVAHARTDPSQAGSQAVLDWTALQRAIIVRWRSAETSGGSVAVAARIPGVTGTVSQTYTAPAVSAPAPAPVHHPAPAPAARQPLPSGAALRAAVAGAGRLSSTPGFAVAAPPVASSSPSSAPPAGFWDSSTGELVVALIAGLLVGAAIFLIVHRPGAGGVRSRVGVFTPQTPVVVDDAAAALDTAHKVEKTGLWADFVHNVEVSRNPRSPGELVKRGAMFAVVGAVLLYVVSGTALLAFAVLLGWPVVLRATVRRAAEKQRSIFRDTLPGYLQDLASAMRVGRSFVGALAVVAEGADEPSRSEFDRAITDEQLGLPLEESLEAVAKRMEAPDMEQVALIAALNRRSGSNVAEALDRVAEGARDRADMRREVKALTAQAKMSSYVLSALPGFLLVGISFLSPRYAWPFFHTTMGMVCLSIGAAMVFAGWKVMKKISNVKA